MVELLDIDDGSDLVKAKAGNLVPLMERLRLGRELNADSRLWIADRMERKKEGRQKTGVKQGKDHQIRNYSIYVLYKWLTDVEHLKPYVARYWLGKVYPIKDDTMDDIVRSFNGAKIDKVKAVTLGLDFDSRKYRATGEYQYRPSPLQKFGADLSKKWSE